MKLFQGIKTRWSFSLIENSDIITRLDIKCLVMKFIIT